MREIDLIQKRIHGRIDSSLYIKFTHMNEKFSGIVRNISEKGMCINSGVCFPLDTAIDLHIPLKHMNVDFPVIVKWSRQTEGFYDIMGVELLNPSGEYLRMLNNIKSSLITV